MERQGVKHQGIPESGKVLLTSTPQLSAVHVPQKLGRGGQQAVSDPHVTTAWNEVGRSETEVATLAKVTTLPKIGEEKG